MLYGRRGGAGSFNKEVMLCPGEPKRRFFQQLQHCLRIRVAETGGNGIILNVFRIPFSAEVAKSVDAVDSKSTAARRAGSIPAFGTIGTSIDVNGRLFLCLKSSIRKAFLAFSLNLSQPDSIYINLLMRVQLRVYRGSIMFVPTQNP